MFFIFAGNFGLMLKNVPVNNFSVMLDGAAVSWVLPVLFGGEGGKYVLLKDTTRRPEWGSNPQPLDPESEVLTTMPPRPQLAGNDDIHKSLNEI